MAIEQEIDEIFLHNAQPTSDTNKIRNLQEYIERLGGIKSHLEVISDQVVGIKTNFEIYDIQLDSLAKDLQMIQDKNRELETRLNRDKDVFEKLKSLTLALSIDDTHLQILDNGSFTKMDDLVKMQESLNILAGFRVEKYTIRIVRETKEKVLRCQRDFFKRFVSYLNKTFVRSESQGELKVHRDLYNKIKQYRFIFTHSKKYEDTFKMVFGSYTLHSKRLYEAEFAAHIDAILKLVNDPEKMQLSMDVLIKSFESLVTCELNFLINLVEEDETGEQGAIDIFKGVSGLIFEFLDQMFKQSRAITIISLSKIASDSETPRGLFLRSFRGDLYRKFELLQDRFVKDEEEKLRKNIKLDSLQQVLNQKGMSDLKSRMLRMYLTRYLRKVDEISLEKLIYRFKAIHSLRIPFEVERELPSDSAQKGVVLSEIMHAMEARIVSDVFGGDDEVGNVKRVVEMIRGKSTRPTEAELLLLKNVRAIVLENCSTENKTKYGRIFQ
ncbi:hypothetical protein ECANGB1_1670 [Enterospora canceri]|uniref:Exocyst complex component Sec3 coiled-coil domain-containing protein n=1 Tax=Enterospora canceri TaxID=1081671 RepID=A0A1Y1S973_9MICR|nr:hypothetical protein ECANGB1_1670 [Enterospora canceri]